MEAFKNGFDAKRFAMAGKARLTVRSLKTGVRFTYKITRKNEDSPFFVSVLTGSDNESDYSYIGTIFPDNLVFRHTWKSKISQGAPSVIAFQYVWKYISENVIPPMTEVFHEGRCGKCARVLTVPESIVSGLGPICAKGGLDAHT